jgi:subtilisin
MQALTRTVGAVECGWVAIGALPIASTSGDPMRTRLTVLLLAATALTLVVPSTVGAMTTDTTQTDVVIAVRGPIPDGRGMTASRLAKLRAAIRSQARVLGITPLETFTSTTRAFSARITAQQRDQLQGDPRVLGVMDDNLIDGVAALEDSDSKITGRPIREELLHQVTPTWLKRIGVTTKDRRLGSGKHRQAFDADIAIIDSGISPNHPDVRPVGGKDCTHSGGWGDGYGHGLGVASILGARDNHRGIVGILPGVRLWSVRIFDRQGQAKMSWVLCGLDWVANKRDPHDHHKPFFEGATLSFSVGDAGSRRVPDGDCGRHPLDLIHQAICRIERQGTILVAAAGNYGQPAARRRPAGYRQVITVSAMADFDGRPGGKGLQSRACRAGAALERDDRFASFSSYGRGVDLIAPGKCIWVAYRGKSYARVSGTSFAAPMVLGAALLYRRRYPSAGPNQVRMALIYSGRHDWRLSSDPDQSHEPKVDVRHFAPPPTFTYSKPSRRTIHRGGDTVTVTLRAHRRHGHTARIRIRTIDAPHGVHVTIDGSHVTIHASESADAGRRTVTLRASDGEVERTIHIPIRVKRSR